MKAGISQTFKKHVSQQAPNKALSQIKDWTFCLSTLPRLSLRPYIEVIPVEMEDPFTRMCQNFFSFPSQIKQRGYVIATTLALSFSFFLPSTLH